MNLPIRKKNLLLILICNTKSFCLIQLLHISSLVFYSQNPSRPPPATELSLSGPIPKASSVAQHDHRSHASPELLPCIGRRIDPSASDASAHNTIVFIHSNWYILNHTSHYRRWQHTSSSENHRCSASDTRLAFDSSASTTASPASLQWYENSACGKTYDTESCCSTICSNALH